ncbi:hypothetical protein M5D96_003869 [Drosophila gunungcola]|uniref:Uncharacterized protein n=1 Tax=Drosophila gunungcola TaxID=103775 RepID=A0A9P9YT14_9MUSC|nr:hypothetical protein M5D96_003869 [Drosophila gunungcola]
MRCAKSSSASAPSPPLPPKSAPPPPLSSTRCRCQIDGTLNGTFWCVDTRGGCDTIADHREGAKHQPYT